MASPPSPASLGAERGGTAPAPSLTSSLRAAECERRRQQDAEPPAGAAQGGGDAAAGQGSTTRPAEPPQGGGVGAPVHDQRQGRPRASCSSDGGPSNHGQ